MHLTKATKENTSFISEWFIGDAPGNEFISFYKDTNEWLNLVTNSSNRYGYLAIYNGETIGFIDIEIDEPTNTAHIAFGIAPNKRGQGMGKVLIEETILLIKQKFKTSNIIAGVQKDNIASQKLFTKIGFRLVNDKDDIRTYEFQIAKTH